MHTIKGYKDEWRIQEYVLITLFIRSEERRVGKEC